MESEQTMNGFITFIGALVFGLGLLYAGGWSVAWADFIATKKSFYLGHGLAIEFNNRYYGVVFNPRFFDSPVISWVIGIIAFSTVSAGMSALVADEDDDDEES